MKFKTDLLSVFLGRFIYLFILGEKENDGHLKNVSAFSFSIDRTG